MRLVLSVLALLLVISSAKAQDDFHIRGVNLGGWLVLEPWITPSLFYQFEPLDKPAIDMYHFCSMLGSIEGNRQLREHFATFVTEDDIAEIASLGLNTVRIPVGYWMFENEPKAPYADCTDGSVEELDRVLKLVDQHNLTAIIDLHGMRDSQNGFDNSGWTRDAIFEEPRIPTRILNPRAFENPNGEPKFRNLRFTIKILEKIAELYKDNPAVFGLNLVNEPWLTVDIDLLKAWYIEAYRAVKDIAPDWKIVMDVSFRANEWEDFILDELNGLDDAILDTHIYHAFDDGLLVSDGDVHLDVACNHGAQVEFMDEDEGPTIVGEWSLATDDCCQFLLGFNVLPRTIELADQGAPPCGSAECPESIGLPSPRPGEDGPDGEGNCPIDAEADDEFLQDLASRFLNSFDRGHGWIFWNFKNELEPRWSYLEAARRGWFPPDVSVLPDEVLTACD